MKKFKRYTLCINCMLCYAACSVRPGAGIPRPGGDLRGAPYNPGFPRWWPGPASGGDRHRRPVGMLVRRCLSEVCPKHVDPPAPCSRSRWPAPSTGTRTLDALGEKMSSKPCSRDVQNDLVSEPATPPSATWPRSHLHFHLCLHVPLLIVALAWLAQRRDAFQEFLDRAAQSTGRVVQRGGPDRDGVSQHVVVRVTPQAMPFRWAKSSPGKIIVSAHYGAWAVVSLIVLFLGV